jgi:hypothetical protein
MKKKSGISKSDFNRVWSYLVAGFPEANELGDLNFEVYYDALHEFPAEQILDGIKRFINQSGSKFFPSAPQIRAWVSPKLTSEDKTFELAIRQHEEAEYKKATTILNCLKEMVDTGFVFCQIRISQDDPYRDTWNFIPLDEATGKNYIEPTYLTENVKKYGRFTIGKVKIHHLMNAIGSWQWSRLKDGEVIDAEIQK